MELMDLKVGDRIQEESSLCRGSIRYIGSVITSKDPSVLYYGIEWDDTERGRNDGSVVLPDGTIHRYFTSQSTNCSFLKASKFIQKIKPFRALLDVIQERYKEEDEEEDVWVTGQVPTTGAGNSISGRGSKPIELVGVAKLRTKQKLQTLEKIALSNLQIASIYTGTNPFARMQDLTPNLKELDLSSNLIGSIQFIFDLLHELPLLQSLILSGNRMHIDETNWNDTELVSSLPVYEKLNVLVLNGTYVPWSTIFSICCRSFPSLNELYVAGNGYEDKDLSVMTEGTLEKLTTLDLSRNKLIDFRTVEGTISKDRFPALQHFFLNENQLKVTNLEKKNVVPSLPTVSTLILSTNQIDSWAALEHILQNCPNLTALRFQYNPLISEMSVAESRLLLIARSDQKVKILNGSDITIRERHDSEVLYYQRILRELLVLGTNPDSKSQVLASHPRYHKLQALYPEIEMNQQASNNLNLKSSTISSNLVALTLTPVTVENIVRMEPLEKKFPRNFTISQLKVFISKKFGIDITQQILSLQFQGDRQHIPVLLDDDNCELEVYSVEDGVTILINST